jgi:hypothetical protein
MAFEFVSETPEAINVKNTDTGADVVIANTPENQSLVQQYAPKPLTVEPVGPIVEPVAQTSAAPYPVAEPIQQVPTQYQTRTHAAETSAIDPSLVAKKEAPKSAVPSESATTGALGTAATNVGDSSKQISDLAKQQADIMMESQKQQQRMQSQQKIDEFDKESKVSDAVSKFEQLSDAYAKGGSIDPGRFWKNAGTIGKIGAAISIALSGIGMALAGKPGENPALKIIQDAVDQDIALQKMDLDKAGKAVEAQRGIVAMVRQQHSDTVSQNLQAQASAWKLAEMKLATVGAQMKGAETSQQYKTLMDGILLKQAEAKDALAQQARERETVKQAVGSTGGGVYADTFITKPSELAGKMVKSPYFHGAAWTDAQASKLNEAGATIDNAAKSIDKLIEISKQSGREFIPSKAKATADVLSAMLTSAIRQEVVGPGAVSETEWAILKSIVANPTNIMQMSDNTRERLITLKENLIQSVRAKAKAAGARVSEDELGFEKRK